ncbi:hypothetical protein [Allopontixanthobacter sp.]|uniref:DUF3617 domain-containing protein n=1 Tax=Allopontixanthobacter sp. TaxID=2906452 RepID=UPI002AB9919C|nr:hypothetical protein [Allopontixanthobacter sp.]MDZ4308372.1 hypothetical protein [Allopontixanthobacter sp.]
MKGGVTSMKAKGPNRFWPKAFLALLPAAFFLAPVAAQAPSLTMLGELLPGEWELRFRDGTPTRSICLRTGRELIQLRHPGSDCGQYVVDDTATRSTVQYTCPGMGYGLTSIRKETASLVQIKSAGLAGSRAFDFAAEARRVGNCR